MQTESKVITMNKKAITLFLLLACLLPSALVSGADIVITSGSSAAYVFCAKSKNNCPKSAVGRWMFKLQLDDNVLDASKKQDAFRDVVTGGSSKRLRWDTGTPETSVKDRVYVGYGEFKVDPIDPTKGTFSGIVDVPPGPPPVGGSCPAYDDYCTMGKPDGAVTVAGDVPLRVCKTHWNWTSSSGPAASTCSNWSPNTGVIECAHPLGTFGTNFGNGIGNCVAQYVQRRSSGFCMAGYNGNEYLYQARVYNLQIREFSDFTDQKCAPIAN